MVGMVMQGGKIKTWKLRYCCLHDGELLYFTDADAAKPKGAIPLAGHRCVRRCHCSEPSTRAKPPLVVVSPSLPPRQCSWGVSLIRPWGPPSPTFSRPSRSRVETCDVGRPNGINLVPTSKRAREWHLAAPTEAEQGPWTDALTAAIAGLREDSALPLPPQTMAKLPAYEVVEDDRAAGGMPAYDVVDRDSDNGTEYAAPVDDKTYDGAEYAAPVDSKAAAADRDGGHGYCTLDESAVVYNTCYASGVVGALAAEVGAMELPPVPAHLQAETQLPPPPVRVAPVHVPDENLYEAPDDDVFHDFPYFWPNTQREQAEVLLPRVSSCSPRRG